MTQALFDITAVTRNQHRASAMPDPALFLQERATDQLAERLTEINRGFTSPAIVTGFPEIWQARLPGATMIAPDETLDLNLQTHDLILHALNLHWANDPVGQMIQCRRALKPDGLFLAVLFGGRTLHELRSSLAEAESTLKDGLSPRISPMAELRDLGGLLMRAGFALPVADSDLVSIRYRGLNDLMRDLRAMGEGNALTARPRHFTPRGLFKMAEDIYARHFSDADGRLTASFEMIYLTGWADSDTQQKPLRPGSATMRLADALNTEELTAGEAVDPFTGKG